MLVSAISIDHVSIKHRRNKGEGEVSSHLGERLHSIVVLVLFSAGGGVVLAVVLSAAHKQRKKRRRPCVCR